MQNAIMLRSETNASTLHLAIGNPPTLKPKMPYGAMPVNEIYYLPQFHSDIPKIAGPPYALP